MFLLAAPVPDLTAAFAVPQCRPGTKTGITAARNRRMAAYRLYNTTAGPVVERDGAYYRIDRPWDELCNDDALPASLETFCSVARAMPGAQAGITSPLAPIGRQEVWASGVTYLRSRVARMEEARQAGGGDFYDRVYDAERPELFFKATADRVVGPGVAMHLRSDSKLIVPEPS